MILMWLSKFLPRKFGAFLHIPPAASHNLLLECMFCQAERTNFDKLLSSNFEDKEKVKVLMQSLAAPAVNFRNEHDATEMIDKAKTFRYEFDPTKVEENFNWGAGKTAEFIGSWFIRFYLVPESSRVG